MTAALSAPLREKLTKVCALLASEHDGERAAAALAATRLLAGAGLAWTDVLSPTATVTVVMGGTQPDSYAAEAFRRAADEMTRVSKDPWRAFQHANQHPDLRFLWTHADLLTVTEREALVTRVRSDRSDLTTRQRRLVAALVDLVRDRLAKRAAA